MHTHTGVGFRTGKTDPKRARARSVVLALVRICALINVVRLGMVHCTTHARASGRSAERM